MELSCAWTGINHRVEKIDLVLKNDTTQITLPIPKTQSANGLEPLNFIVAKAVMCATSTV
jgi:hypothetical protein